MKIENESFADLTISAGKITAKCSWILTADDVVPGGGELAAAARVWAGAVGDPLKVPSQDGTVFTSSSEFLVTGIVCAMLTRRRCRVTFTAEPAEATEFSGSYHEERRGDGTILRTGTWKRAASAALFPAVGEAFTWEGGDFVCESCNADLISGEYTLTARECVEIELSGPAASVEPATAIPQRSGVWQVPRSGLAAFLAARPLGAAADWAGTGYYLHSVQSEPVGKIADRVTLVAREVLTRKLSVVREESFAGFTSAGAAKLSTLWRAVYQVRPADLPQFQSLVGTSAAAWAVDGAVVTAVKPVRVSPAEYQVTVEARPATDPNLSPADNDDRSDLASRTDVRIDLDELFVSAAMAGYTPSPAGGFQPLANWNVETACPFSGSAPLGANFIDATLRLLRIAFTDYVEGGAKKCVDSMIEWNNSRVFAGSVAGHSGNYLKVRQTCVDVYSDDGALFGKRTCIYWLAPAGKTWNTAYWSGR